MVNYSCVVVSAIPSQQKDPKFESCGRKGSPHQEFQLVCIHNSCPKLWSLANPLCLPAGLILHVYVSSIRECWSSLYLCVSRTLIVLQGSRLKWSAAWHQTGYLGESFMCLLIQREASSVSVGSESQWILQTERSVGFKRVRRSELWQSDAQRKWLGSIT